ncbi:deoxyribose-phosphate aldolase [Flavobacterium agricola]|uniref:Deoxyribose-phosphate aldolase n=1 Tax=Flavobacterium agricola TaxID=2870839 RepID=A0ABY6LYY6_9FLAO|nr:deoxyribose-phosphate aldolase [Flavobacterium agricola]UYW00762.1 deoxyribose-phosphate aldolase [Flavobacterium agricola]
MDIKQYLDSTYLKTSGQAEVDEVTHKQVVHNFILDTIKGGYKCVMIRPEFVALAKAEITAKKSPVVVGTVISFPEGTNSTQEKLDEAQQAINNGVDELDYVIDYTAFKNQQIDYVKEQVYLATKLGLDNNKVVKWIIETAALTPIQIAQLSALIKNVVMKHFDEKFYEKVFVKSSTGFYKTEPGVANGATREGITLMLENASPLPVKASGGVRNTDEALQFIQLGVKRIGTSSADAIVNGYESTSDY